MLIVLGLGNPGTKYEMSRHNIGFMVVDRLAREIGVTFRRAPYHSLAAKGAIEGADAVLVKPQTYMNNSGLAAAGALRWFKEGAESLLVVYDDMDLEPGMIRIRAKGSSGGHNGMKSIIAYAGTEEIARVRVGIGRPSPWHDSIEHVLGSIARDELQIMSDAVMSATRAILCIAREGLDAAQTQFNSH